MKFDNVCHFGRIHVKELNKPPSFHSKVEQYNLIFKNWDRSHNHVVTELTFPIKLFCSIATEKFMKIDEAGKC